MVEPLHSAICGAPRPPHGAICAPRGSRDEACVSTVPMYVRPAHVDVTQAVDLLHLK